MSTTRRRGAAGFSLLEVLIAMLILSIGAASILALFAAAAATHRRAVDRTQAALVAERVLSEVRNVYRDGSTAADVLATVRARLPDQIDGYRHDLTIVNPEGDEWTDDELFVRLTVRWRESGAERAEELFTVIRPRGLRETP